MLTGTAADDGAADGAVVGADEDSIADVAVACWLPGCRRAPRGAEHDRGRDQRSAS
ncbi:hypothetical protein [Tsukamurella pseudospumae]|uniref:hypothetical protein n=1 Tax=Tsukamurella pseudospumae TaxID=239498 RepID=UPI000B2056D5|nr:hypothetical protein [Tsukamurella pseudospumae]